MNTITYNYGDTVKIIDGKYKEYTGTFIAHRAMVPAGYVKIDNKNIGVQTIKLEYLTK